MFVDGTAKLIVFAIRCNPNYEQLLIHHRCQAEKSAVVEKSECVGDPDFHFRMRGNPFGPGCAQGETGSGCGERCAERCQPALVSSRTTLVGSKPHESGSVSDKRWKCTVPRGGVLSASLFIFLFILFCKVVAELPTRGCCTSFA